MRYLDLKDYVLPPLSHSNQAWYPRQKAPNKLIHWPNLSCDMSYQTMCPSRDSLLKEAEEIALWTQMLYRVNCLRTDEHKDELLDHEISDSCDSYEGQSGGPIRTMQQGQKWKSRWNITSRSLLKSL